jgi:(p)ppGpp synthase/HD superfamily hydrolase
MTKPDYFLINRKLQESDLWLNEPFTRGQAWVDLLGLTHYKPGHIRKDGKRIDLNRGQCGWSQLKLSKRWGWSRGKVKRFLNELEMDQRIEQVNTTICSIITIVNYDAYQPNGHQTDTEQDSRRTADNTTDEQLTDTKNEGVKGSKVLKGLKKKESKPSRPPASVEAKTANKATWESYKNAYNQRYGVDPLRNAAVNGMIAKFTKAVPQDDAPFIAEFFVRHNDRWFVNRKHSVKDLLGSADKLYAEWKTNTPTTSSQAHQIDETAGRGNVWNEMIEKNRRGEL